MQSIKLSMVETILNSASGFVISWILTLFILPLFGFMVSCTQGLGITIIFTVVGTLRTYFIRRFFNNLVRV